MNEGRRNFLVGLFMILGLTVLGCLMVTFGEAPRWLGGAEYEVRVVVNEIAGIDEGTPLYLNGIRVGRVASLDFVNRDAPEEGVVILGMVKNRFTVPAGAVANCIGPALGIGRGRIDIIASGTGAARLKPGDTISGTSVNTLEKIIPDTMVETLEQTVARIGEVAEGLKPVADDLHALLRDAPISDVGQPGGSLTANLRTAVERLDRVLAHVDTLVGDPALKENVLATTRNLVEMSDHARESFADIRAATVELKDDSERIATKVEDVVDRANLRVDELADAALPILDNAARASANLRLASDRLTKEEGTIGLLLNDNRLYEKLVLAIERAQDLIDTLRRLTSRFERKGRIGLDFGGVPIDKTVPP